MTIVVWLCERTPPIIIADTPRTTFIFVPKLFQKKEAPAPRSREKELDLFVTFSEGPA